MSLRGASFFAEELTWKLLDKYDYEPVEIDIDLEFLSGKYTGQVRGQIISIEIDALSNSLIHTTEELSKVDTLNKYICNNTWIDGNSLVTIKNNEYLRDDIYGYYKLRKEQ